MNIYLQELGESPQECCLSALTSATMPLGHQFSGLYQATDGNQTKARPALHHQTKDDAEKGPPKQAPTVNSWLHNLLLKAG